MLRVQLWNGEQLPVNSVWLEHYHIENPGETASLSRSTKCQYGSDLPLKVRKAGTSPDHTDFKHTEHKHQTRTWQTQPKPNKQKI